MSAYDVSSLIMSVIYPKVVPDFDFPIRAKSLSFFDNKWPFEIKYVSNNVVNRRPRKSRFILILDSWWKKI